MDFEIEFRTHHEAITERLNYIIEELHKMANTQQDLDQAIATLQGTVNTLQSTVQGLLTTLQSITPGSPAPDFTAEVNELNAIATALSTLQTNVAAEETTLTTTPAPTPVTTPAPTSTPSGATSDAELAGHPRIA